MNRESFFVLAILAMIGCFPLLWLDDLFIPATSAEATKVVMGALSTVPGKEAEELREIRLAPTIKTTQQLLLSNWCVRHEGEKVYAEYIYHGDSLCRKHFLEAMAK